ncbi:MAG TPA: STAS domain-containing protein [Nocardioidaceae bacterium]|nr:STAS domain-containing protein [Nocardioidaceae bacterium]
MDVLGIDPRLSEVLFVLKVSGDLDLETQSRFEATVFDLLDRGSVVVDLTRLEFMAISSLRSLVLGHRYAASRRHALVFAGPSRQTRRLLSVARLDSVLHIRPSVTAACDDLPVRADAVRATYWLGKEAIPAPSETGDTAPGTNGVRRPEWS